MFHRKRASSNPPRVVNSPPSAVASLAATQAFLANRASSANLSNAAAAAALRSHTTTPTPVGQVQTRRMQRRGSISSNGGASDRPGLQRRGSGGSLTERTFRDTASPAPKRPASAQGPYTRYEEPPPVPALPKNYFSPSPVPQMDPIRPARVELPERISSPLPRLPGGRGASLDRGPRGFTGNKGGCKPRVSSLDTVGEVERAGSRSSINFSRPMSPQNSSPTSSLAGARVKSPPPTQPTVVSSVPNAKVNRIMNSIEEAAAAPVKKKKKAAAKDSAEGSHLALYTTSVPHESTLGTTPQQQPAVGILTPPASDPGSSPGGLNEAPKPKKKKKKKNANLVTGSQPPGASEEFGNAYPSDTDSVSSELSSTTDRARNYNTRAAGLLIKQPSIVREDREAEEQEDTSIPTRAKNGQVAQNGTVGATTPANALKVLSKDRQHNRTASQPEAPKGPKRTSLDIPGGARPQSLSPVRAAHFSSHPEYETPGGAKHQPPARSVSPAKSALKHSPSRGQSPTTGRPTGRRASFAPGEVSDTTSNISEDGLRSVSKKKKGVRVSFDDDSVAVGRAASTPDSPVIASPRNKSKGRSWFDLVRERNQEGAVNYLDQDSIIKPMPTLPSFGSIRGRRDESVLESAQGQRLSEDWAKDSLPSMDTSTDQIVGMLIAQDSAAKAKKDDAQTAPQSDPTEPLAPQVTSVEGSGNHSEDEVGLFDNDGDTANKPSLDPSTTVPSIELQPATPALENSGQDKEWLGMPGGFPTSSEGTESNLSSSTSTIPAVQYASPEITPAITPATVGIAEPELEATAHQHEPGAPHVGDLAEGLWSQIEAQSGDDSDDTSFSIYSDAAEDPDDLEGDGFGSINAIVESPAAPIVPIVPRSPPSSPTVKPPVVKDPVEKVPSAKAPARSPLARHESELSEPGSDDGWDKAQAYWSGLSQTKKQQLEQAALPGAIDDPVIPNKTMRGPDSVKKKKKVPKKRTSPADSNNAALASPQALPQKLSMRKLQPEPMQEYQMRTSMRGGPPAKLALKNSPPKSSTAPPSEPKGALQKKTRPVSVVAMVDYNKSQTNHARAASAVGRSTSLTPVAPPAKKTKPIVRPSVFKNDSDSDSSFKKARASTPSAGKYTMKRTMRPSSMDARPQSPPLAGRTPFPTAGRHPFSSVGPGGATGSSMRTTMRGSIDSGKPARTSLRESVDSKRPKSPSRFGFGKSKVKPVEPKPASRFSSRFSDSSDDGDYRLTPRSRFADSSDEDEPAGLTPVRGIPRRTDEGDSTDLEDSSVENVPAPSRARMNGTEPAVNTKPEGAALATGSLRVPSGDAPTAAMGSGLQAKKAAEKEKKKRSFFSVLGSRKKSDDPTRVRKSDAESAARRDTPLERSKAERKLSAGPSMTDERVLAPSSPTVDPVPQTAHPDLGSRSSTAASSPKSPKLQRRNTPKKTTMGNDISWPLPQDPKNGIQSAPDSRPHTSDGAGVSKGNGIPNIGRIQSEIGPPRTAPLVVGKAEKKKRFGMLKRAFGLHD